MLAAFVTKRRKKAFLSPNIFIFGFIFVPLHAEFLCAYGCMRAVRWKKREKYELELVEKYKNLFGVSGM